jgi:site-specific DNA-methyltransferase (adenine-specific)
MSEIDDYTQQIHTGDALEQLAELPADSVHTCVTDPPYGLAFMGRDWDDFEPKEYQQWCEKWAREVKRVLKPGGHLLAFSGNRTHHRLFTGVEDAGFEIRDTLTWHYGSGFPKAADMAKTIQKREGVEPEEITDSTDNGMGADDSDYNDCYNQHHMPEPDGKAKEWDGWKTGLKPATEYAVMARKPFDGATVDCVQEHGTGALNIDGTRIGTEERENAPPGENDIYSQAEGGHGTVEGRYPSNVVFDETEARRLDADVGELDGCQPHTVTDNGDRTVLDDGGLEATGDRVEGYDDAGGPSRYFYTSKASKSERTEDGSIDNAHPTVKPQDLMEWLVKLVTRENQIVIDPFAGSGTTCKAAKALNRRFIGIEKQAKWADVARARCNLTPENPAVVRDDDAQAGLDDYGGDE